MWPDFFPTNCPPADAEKKSIEVYRLVDHNPPTAADFVSEYEKNPKRHFNSIRLACGLSCYTNKQHAEKQNELLFQSAYFRRHRLPLKLLAIGKTDPSCGVVKDTPNGLKSHVTYWVKKNVNVSGDFKVI